MMNYNHFFMCGVPGGVDYLMLFLVKHSWMTPLEEKRIATVINVWFRAPWLVSVACFGCGQPPRRITRDLPRYTETTLDHPRPPETTQLDHPRWREAGTSSSSSTTRRSTSFSSAASSSSSPRGTARPLPGPCHTLPRHLPDTPQTPLPPSSEPAAEALIGCLSAGARLTRP